MVLRVSADMAWQSLPPGNLEADSSAYLPFSARPARRADPGFWPPGLQTPFPAPFFLKSLTFVRFISYKNNRAGNALFITHAEVFMKPWSKTVQSAHVYQVILVLCLVAAMACPCLAAKRTALVIGNSNYAVSPLANPVNDATDIAALLRGFGFEVTLKTDVDLRTMENAIREFGRQLRDGGAGLFYFAGHGLQVKGENYLVPIGAVLESEGDVRYEAVNAGLVLGKMEDARNKLNIVILDACRNNPFARNFRSSNPGLARMDARCQKWRVYQVPSETYENPGAGH